MLAQCPRQGERLINESEFLDENFQGTPPDLKHAGISTDCLGAVHRERRTLITRRIKRDDRLLYVK